MAQVTVTAQYIADTASYVRNVRSATEVTNQLARQMPTVSDAVDELNNSSRDAADGMSVLKVAAGSALGIALVQMATKAAFALKSFAMESFHAAARVEELDVSMQAIGKSTGVGYDAIKEAADGVRSMGIEAASAQQIAIQFAQANLDMAQASKIARVAQDLAVVAGLNSTDTTNRLIQAIITGNSELLRAAGISKTASQAQKAYAEEMGKSVGKLTALEKQQAMVNMIMEEGKNVSGTYEAAMSSAGKVLRSFPRIINDIQVSFGMVLSEAFGPLVKATYDLAKAFSKSMQDGGSLVDTFDSLKAVATSLTEPIIEATNAVTDWIKQGDGLKSISDRMTMIANSIANAIPVVFALIDSLMNLSSIVSSTLFPIFDAFISVLGSLLELIAPITAAFAAMPAPLKAVVGVFVLLQIAMAKSTAAAAVLGLSWTALRVNVVGATQIMGANVKLFATQVALSFKSMRAQTTLLGTSVKLMKATTLGAFKAISAGAKALMAGLGPIGWILLAVSAAMEVFMGKSQVAEHYVANLKEEIEGTTGALTELGAAFVAAELRENFGPETLADLQKLGISMQDMIRAIEQGGPAMDSLMSKLLAADSSDILGPMGRNTVQRTIEGAREATEFAQRAAADQALANEDAARRTEHANRVAAAEAIAAVKQQEAEQARALANMSASEKSAANFTKNAAAAMEQAYDSARGAIEELDAAAQAMTDAISAEASYDKARKSIKELGESFKDNGKKITGFSDKALDNREAIRDAASAYIDYANSLNDPIERQAVLEEGQKKITKAMEKAGVDPKKSKILKTMKEESEQSGETVDEFAKQREKAALYGNEVGKNWIDGIIAQIRDGKGDVTEASQDLVSSALLDAANDAQNASSPAKESMKIAKNFVDGIVVGIKENQKLAKMKTTELVDGMLDALESKMDEFKEKILTARDALNTVGDLTGGLEAKFGLPSKIMDTFGEGASASGILSGYSELSGAVQDMFAPMLDKEIVPKSVVKKNRRLLKQAMDDLDSYTQFAVDRVKERESLQQRMSDLDKSYTDSVNEINSRYNDLDKAAAAEYQAAEKRFTGLINGINSRYDALDAAAAANIKRIEDHYDQLIPTLEAALSAANDAYDKENKVLSDLVSERDGFLKNISTGFRGFLNNLRVDGDAASRTITKTTEKIVNGIRVLTEETFTEEVGGGGFAAALQGRLESLRDFSSNIKALLSRGLDPTLVRDFVSAGVDSAGETVAALASGSDDQISQINAAQSELGALIESFQQESSAEWFDYGIAQQEAIVAPLKTAADEAQIALEQAKVARETELEAARAHAEALRVNRQAELARAQADRDAELERIRAYQEQLRADREAELLAAKNSYDKQRQEIEDRLDAIEVELSDNAQKINDRFTSLQADLLPKMKKFGVGIINGLIKGLKKREGALYAKARSIADRIRAEINAAFQFGSPSKVTTTMGKQIAQGLIVGMDSQMRNVAKTASDLADQAMVPIAMPTVGSVGSGAPSTLGAMPATAGLAAAGTNISVTVNAGMGTDGAEVGRQVVEAIRKYERRSGPVFVSA